MEIQLRKTISGRILDIGGGGEGIIGRLYGSQVTAIDIAPAELAEAPGGYEKVVMDATALTYPDGSFDGVTAFYGLMFFTARQQRLAIAEAARVLKPGGVFCLWDCRIDRAWPEPFLTDLTIRLPEETVHTTYGVGKREGQTMEGFLELCASSGLSLREARQQAGHFYLQFQKE